MVETIERATAPASATAIARHPSEVVAISAVGNAEASPMPPLSVAETVAAATARLTDAGPSDWMAMLDVRNQLCDFINAFAAASDPDDYIAELQPAEELCDRLTTTIDNASGDGAHEAQIALAFRLSDEGFDMRERLLALHADGDEDRNVAVYRTASARRHSLMAQSTAERLKALADAATPDEVQLINDLFDAIPRSLALCDDHALGEVIDREDLAAVETDWHAAMRQVEEIGQKILDLPVTTAADGFRRVKLYRLALALYDGPALGHEIDDVPEEDARVLGGAAIKALQVLSEREHRVDGFAYHRAARLHAEVVAGLADRADDEELPEAFWNSLEAVWRAHSPDIEALAAKMRLHLGSVIADRLADDIDDPRHFSAMLAEAQRDAIEAEQLNLYQDMLRLAGVRPEIADAQPYDPSELVYACEAAEIGLKVCDTNDHDRIVVPFLKPNAPRRLDLEQQLEGLIRREVNVVETFLRRPDVDPADWHARLLAAGGTVELRDGKVWAGFPVHTFGSDLIMATRSPKAQAAITAYLNGLPGAQQ